jgi:hypothetical protein
VIKGSFYLNFSYIFRRELKGPSRGAREKKIKKREGEKPLIGW